MQLSCRYTRYNPADDEGVTARAARRHACRAVGRHLAPIYWRTVMTSSAPQSTLPLAPRRAAALLTPRQLAHYASKAWVAVPGFFSPAQTAQIASWVEEL